MSLGEARDQLRTMVEHGHECPCCHQLAKVYKRRINAGMAWGLIRMYRVSAHDWVHVPDLNLPGGDMVKLRYWGLIENPPGERRDDGSPRSGKWRFTELGRQWVRGKATVPERARIYDEECLRLFGRQISIHDALGTKFDYRELMSE
jgi:hypothetical protein